MKGPSDFRGSTGREQVGQGPLEQLCAKQLRQRNCGSSVVDGPGYMVESGWKTVWHELHACELSESAGWSTEPYTLAREPVGWGASEGRIPDSGATTEFFKGEGGRLLRREVVFAICAETRLPSGEWEEEGEDELRGWGKRLVGEVRVGDGSRET